MPKYRKKPVVIEAYQMTLGRRQHVSDWPEWLRVAWTSKDGVVGSVQPDGGYGDAISIVTLEGDHRVSWGDFIIRGVQGELYPCKPDIFRATYENLDGTEVP